VPVHANIKFKTKEGKKRSTKVIGYVQKGDVILSMDQGFYNGIPRLKIHFMVQKERKKALKERKSDCFNSCFKKSNDEDKSSSPLAEAPHLEGMDVESRAKRSETLSLSGTQSERNFVHSVKDKKLEPEPEPEPESEAADAADTEATEREVAPEDGKTYEEDGHTWKEGWVSFCDTDGGIAAERYFVLSVNKKETGRKKAGKIKLRLRKEKDKVTVTVLMCKELRKVDFIGQNDDYVIVKINEDDEGGGQQKQTSVLSMAGANPVWNGGKGEELEFEGIQHLNRVHVQCYDEDEGDFTTDDLIGECNLPLDEIIDVQRERNSLSWVWEGWRVVREPDGAVASLLPDHNPLHLLKAIENKGRNLVNIADHIITDATGQIVHAADTLVRSPTSKPSEPGESSVPSTGQEDTFENPLAASSALADAEDPEAESMPNVSALGTFDVEPKHRNIGEKKGKKKKGKGRRNPFKTSTPRAEVRDFDIMESADAAGGDFDSEASPRKASRKKNKEKPSPKSATFQLGDSDSV
jgi:hypothetical protein